MTETDVILRNEVTKNPRRFFTPLCCVQNDRGVFMAKAEKFMPKTAFF